MPYYVFVWSQEIIDHIAENDISVDDFERVVCRPDRDGESRSSGLPAAFGYTEDGRYIIAIYKEVDAMTLVPVTAYEINPPR